MQKEGKTFDPLKDGMSKIQLIDCMGEDLSVVNDARASFEKISSELNERDKKLINYLVKHDHTSPLRGTIFKFRVTAPLFVCRQWWKHIIGSVHAADQIGWNEKSYRYTSSDFGAFYMPPVFHGQSDDNRQASGGPLTPEKQNECKKIYFDACHKACESYQALLDAGVAREVARGVLPQSIYTTWVWTASLQAVLNFVELRLGHGAQKEIQKYAYAVKEIIAGKVPVTMQAWAEKNNVKELLN